MLQREVHMSQQRKFLIMHWLQNLCRTRSLACLQDGPHTAYI